MSAPTREQKLLSTIGLCARARRLVMGTPMVCEALRKASKAPGKPPVLAVLEAADTSENTHGKLVAKCAYYSVPHYRLTADTATLAHAIGKSGAVAAVGITDASLLSACVPNLPPPTDLPKADSPENDQPACKV